MARRSSNTRLARLRTKAAAFRLSGHSCLPLLPDELIYCSANYAFGHARAAPTLNGRLDFDEMRTDTLRQSDKRR